MQERVQSATTALEMELAVLKERVRALEAERDAERREKLLAMLRLNEFQMTFADLAIRVAQNDPRRYAACEAERRELASDRAVLECALLAACHEPA